MVASHFDFVNVVAADRDLVVSSAHEHACRLEPRESDIVWHCDLDDGTPTDSDRDPAAFVRWVCPVLRVRSSATGTAVPMVDVHRAGPHSDLGGLLARLASVAGGASGRTSGGDARHRFVYTDPAGILDVAVRRRIENWPTPAGLWSIACTGEGLVVESVSWWDSAPALDHQIGLAVDIARRLAAQRTTAATPPRPSTGRRVRSRDR